MEKGLKSEEFLAKYGQEILIWFHTICLNGHDAYMLQREAFAEFNQTAHEETTETGQVEAIYKIAQAKSVEYLGAKGPDNKKWGIIERMIGKLIQVDESRYVVAG